MKAAHGILIRDVAGVDTVTLSDEGLARANVREWRDYAENNEALFHNGATSREELYKELNVVNNLDTASMFNCELGEVAKQIQKENGFGDRSRDWCNVERKNQRIVVQIIC